MVCQEYSCHCIARHTMLHAFKSDGSKMFQDSLRTGAPLRPPIVVVEPACTAVFSTSHKSRVLLFLGQLKAAIPVHHVFLAGRYPSTSLETSHSPHTQVGVSSLWSLKSQSIHRLHGKAGRLLGTFTTPRQVEVLSTFGAAQNWDASIFAVLQSCSTAKLFKNDGQCYENDGQ